MDTQIVVARPISLDAQAMEEIAPLLNLFKKTGEDHERAAEKLGRSLIRWRDEYKARGQAGSGFKALLNHLKISRATAYRLMRRVETDFVSPETKPFNLELTLKGLTRWAERLPHSLKDCPEEAFAQLSAVQARVNQLVEGIRADAHYISRVQSERRKSSDGSVKFRPGPSRRRSFRVSKRSPITQDKLDHASIGVVGEYSGNQRVFVFGDRLHRLAPESLAAHLARLPKSPPPASSSAPTPSHRKEPVYAAKALAQEAQTVSA